MRLTKDTGSLPMRFSPNVNAFLTSGSAIEKPAFVITGSGPGRGLLLGPLVAFIDECNFGLEIRRGTADEGGAILSRILAPGSISCVVILKCSDGSEFLWLVNLVKINYVFFIHFYLSI